MKKLIRNLGLRTNGIVALLALFGLLVCSQSAMAEDPVYFADSKLKAAVESELGITDPTPTDMLALNVLEAYGNYYSKISDLTGIEYASNLTGLHLAENQISDLSPLSGLTSLEHLNLNFNQISDLSPLSGLTSLWDLQLHTNQISDLSPLSGLTNLKWLYLYINPISDISALSGLTNLTVLFLNDTYVSDISPLSGLTSLIYLELHFNQVSDISPLAEITSLEHLSFTGSPLNVEAYCTYLRLIENNNPGIDLFYSTNPYPPESCCEADFDCDGDVDGADATTFKLYFGRNPLSYPCDEINPCHGDFDCDQDCDGNDAALFKEDFGRNESNNPCPACEVINWCSY